MINLISLGLVLLAVFWSGYTCCSFNYEVDTVLQCAATADLVRWSSLPERWVMLSEFPPQGTATGRSVCPVLRSIGCADGSDGPDQSQGIGARRLCQPRHEVSRVDDATRTPEPLLHHSLGGPAGGEVKATEG